MGSIAGWIEALGQDLCYAARGMRKRPAFTLVVVLTLALGIGGTTTIFSAVDALLLRPFSYPDQDRLVALSNNYPRFPRDRGPVSGTDVAHWRADNQGFEQIEFVSGPDMGAMILSFLGVMIGVAASFAAAPLLARFLYAVNPHDVLTFVLVSSLLIAVTLFASYIPARHATEINPMDTLRHD